MGYYFWLPRLCCRALHGKAVSCAVSGMHEAGSGSGHQCGRGEAFSCALLACHMTMGYQEQALAVPA